MRKEFFKTHDGSYTLFLPEMDETYHSKFGAIKEALHVFINSGLSQINLPVINILEIGFGTGLNTFLSLKYLLTQEKIHKINYHSIEKYPLKSEIINFLNYAVDEDEQKIFRYMHETEWNQAIEIIPGFQLYKDKTDLIKFELDSFFDLIYFDAFAPNKQPELWSQSIFEKMYRHMNTGGILVTYSAKGQVRRNMQSAGFIVERIPGPPGKREMLRAYKK